MLVHLLPATVYTAKALVRNPSTADCIHVVPLWPQVNLPVLQAAYNNASWLKWTHPATSLCRITLPPIFSFSVENGARQAACRRTKVSCPFLQRMGPSWVPAWALVGMAMAVALGGQSWCSAPMEAAASSPFLWSSQPSSSSVRWQPTLEVETMLVSANMVLHVGHAD